MVEAFKIIGGKKIEGELKVDGSKNSHYIHVKKL